MPDGNGMAPPVCVEGRKVGEWLYVEDKREQAKAGLERWGGFWSLSRKLPSGHVLTGEYRNYYAKVYDEDG